MNELSIHCHSVLLHTCLSETDGPWEEPVMKLDSECSLIRRLLPTEV